MFVVFSSLLVLTIAPQSPAPIVFFDIAGPDAPALQTFYREVFHWDISGGGELTIPVTSPLPGLIRPDPTEKRIYIGVEDVAATLVQIEDRGGTIDAPRFEVPGVVVLGLFTDPAGNRMALVEMEEGRPKVP